MGAPSEISWDMYEPRTTTKVEAVEDITIGKGCYIHTDGKAYLCDNGKNDRFHGCALLGVKAGEKVVLVTHGRLNVTSAQTIGAKAMVSNQSGGGAPSTAASGTACAGYAVEEYLLVIHAGRGADT